MGPCRTSPDSKDFAYRSLSSFGQFWRYHRSQKQFSILLATRAPEEHYQLEVSPFGARLPLLSPFAVSLRDRLRIEHQQGRTYWVLFSSLARGPTSCSTYRFAHPRRQRFQAKQAL